MERREFLQSLTGPLLIPREYARPQEPAPPRVVWIQLSRVTGGRKRTGDPSVEDLCAAQCARGRSILAVIQEADEFARIIVAQHLSTYGDALAFLQEMLAKCSYAPESAEQDYGSIEAAIALTENECVEEALGIVWPSVWNEE